MIEERSSLRVTFSFRAMLDIMEVHTGEEALSGVALDAPINCMLNKNVIPPRTMPRIPEAERRAKSFLVIFHFLLGFEKRKRKRDRTEKRMVLAKITLMPFSPRATRIVPIAQHKAQARAVINPLRLILP